MKHKTIYKSILTMMALPLLLAMCTKSDIGPVLQTKVDLKGSSIEADQAYTRFLFSTDGGVTWSATPLLTGGQKYLAQVLDDNNGLTLTPDNFYATDWSASNPAPSDPKAGAAEFTFSDNNHLAVVVGDLLCPYDPSKFTGTWKSVESKVPNGCNCTSTETQHVVQDGTNHNKLTMDNYWGDGVGNATVFMIFSPSDKTVDTQLVDIPTQVTEEGGTAYGSGTYDQCRNTISLHCHYDFSPAPADKFEWIYTFTRP